MFEIIEKEKNRQWKSLELIASEVRTPAKLRAGHPCCALFGALSAPAEHVCDCWAVCIV
jgi:hypothetical protein